MTTLELVDGSSTSTVKQSQKKASMISDTMYSATSDTTTESSLFSNVLSTSPPATSSSSSSSRLLQQRFPLELLFDHVCPFLDRQTLNNFLLVSTQSYKSLTAPGRPSPPWPSKLVSKDHLCRIRSMQFSQDGNELACGCSDGVLRVWNVWSGEQPSLRGHWPGEAVIAVAYSNGNCEDLPLLASSSTDHTIRLWKKRRVQQRPRGPWGKKTKKSASDSSLKNITIQIRDAGHAYALMFSPDDSYLVSGHHPQQRRRRQRDQLDEERHGNDNNAQQQQPVPNQQQQPALVPETIYLWSVSTGLQLRRLENAGMPISFLQSPFNAPAEHRLLSTCAGESLKLWRLGNNSGKKKRRKAQCLQRLFLEGYSTVMPVPMDASTSSDEDDLDLSTHSMNSANDIMVASIDGSDSFSVWNTGGHDCDCVRNPKNCTCHDTLDGSMSSLSSHESGSSHSNSSCKRVQHSFQNTSPYEIRFSNNCSKVASVDNFNRVKVWNVQSGRLLKTFVQSDASSLSSSRHTAGVDLLSNASSSEHSTSSRGQGLPGGFPIHELAFCQDSTVAVVSRFYNEIHLFST